MNPGGETLGRRAALLTHFTDEKTQVLKITLKIVFPIKQDLSCILFISIYFTYFNVNGYFMYVCVPQVCLVSTRSE